MNFHAQLLPLQNSDVTGQFLLCNLSCNESGIIIDFGKRPGTRELTARLLAITVKATYFTVFTYNIPAYTHNRTNQSSFKKLLRSKFTPSVAKTNQSAHENFTVLSAANVHMKAVAATRNVTYKSHSINT